MTGANQVWHSGVRPLVDSSPAEQMLTEAIAQQVQQSDLDPINQSVVQRAIEYTPSPALGPEMRVVRLCTGHLKREGGRVPRTLVLLNAPKDANFKIKTAEVMRHLPDSFTPRFRIPSSHILFGALDDLKAASADQDAHMYSQIVSTALDLCVNPDRQAEDLEKEVGGVLDDLENQANAYILMDFTPRSRDFELHFSYEMAGQEQQERLPLDPEAL